MHMITVFKSWKWSFSLKWGSLDCSWKIRKKVLQLSSLEVFPFHVMVHDSCFCSAFWRDWLFSHLSRPFLLVVAVFLRQDNTSLTSGSPFSQGRPWTSDFYTTTQCGEHRLLSLCWVMWCGGSKLGLHAYWASTLPLKLHPSSLCCCLDCCMSIHTAIASGVALSMV